ncbi:unannotated protein [freshwater metagenome]|uniref:Unannotated protein n=1 Tax=freshwater metagenome TaxID=449393 RepID=A0A6J6H552_9ZZZZ
MYSSARRSVVPLWRRIHVTSFDSTRVVTNCRSSSDRCEVVTIAHRGRPSGRRSIAPMSSVEPRIQAANDGEASSPFRRIANAVRSFGGKNASSSNTPSLRMGGVSAMPTSVGRSRLRPCCHSFRIRFDSRMCSRLDSGSASMPTRPSRPLTYPSISSATVSWSSTFGGACSDPTMFTPTPAAEPGVYTVKSTPARSDAIVSPVMPHPARPSRHAVACPAAKSATDFPADDASPSFTHGWNSAGERPGKVRQRLVRSPFGSISNAGTPERSASSISTTPRPVLPEPVMPTITPWVVRSPESTRVVVSVRCFVAGSTCAPRRKSAIAAESTAVVPVRPPHLRCGA